MNELTVNKNVLTLSAIELLNDWTSGQGATGKMPSETFEHVEEGKLHGQTVSLSLLTAIAEYKTVGALPSFVDAIGKGYLSHNHLSQHKAGTTVKANSTLVTTKANLTAEQYKNNCIKMGLDSKNIAAVIELVDNVYSLTDKTTKADMIILLQSFAHIFINAEQHVVYTAKAIDEEKAALKFASLTEAGFVSIRPMIAGRYCADLPANNLAAIATLASNGYLLVGTQPIQDNTMYQITFKDTDAE